MAAPTDAATPPSTPAAEDGTVAVLLCDGCRCPIGSIWDVLPAEETAPAWKRHVYSYELDLFNNGTAPVQAYSATNPSARRFDLLRLAPQVMVRRPAATAAPSTSPTAAPPAASTTVLAPAFVECDTAVYSTEHSFFTGYAWCFAHCGNCGAFLGWGFAAESRLRAAQRPTQEGHEPQQQQQSNEGSGRLRERAERRADADTEEAQEAQESGTHTRSSSSAAVRDDAAGSSSAPPREDASADAPNAEAGEDEGHHATSSGSAICESDASPDLVHELVDAAAVTPDFIGIVITHCTGEPDYPVAALLRDVEWRAARTRRRSAVAALRQRLRVLLPQMADGYRAHQLYHDFSTVEQLMYTIPPGNEASVTSSRSSTGGHSDSGTSTTASVMNAAVAALLGNADADGVPMRLHAAVQSARIAIARQRQPQNDRNGTRARTRRSSTSSSGDSASEGSEAGSGSS